MSRQRYVTPAERELVQEQWADHFQEQWADYSQHERAFAPVWDESQSAEESDEEEGEESEEGDEEESTDEEDSYSLPLGSRGMLGFSQPYPTNTFFGQRAEERTEQSEDDWLNLVLASIPIEIITAWAVIETILASNPAYVMPRGFWTVFGLVVLATVFHTLKEIYHDTDEDEILPSTANDEIIDMRQRLAKWTAVVQVTLAVSSFIVWAYYLGGPFHVQGWYNPIYAAIILPLYTLFGPQLLPILPPYLVELERAIH